MWQALAGPSWIWGILLAIALAGLLAAVVGFVRLITRPPKDPSRDDL